MNTAGQTLPEGLLLYAAGEEYLAVAEAAAEKLGIPLVRECPAAGGLYLQLDGEGLSLTDGKLSLRGDLTAMLPRLRQANLQRELLVKAAKLKGFTGTPVLVDATAGLGEDSLLLAASGFRVELYEYDPIIAALLADALRRARQVPELQAAAERMQLHAEDSIAALHAMGGAQAPDVVLLDPMFPERQKSALVKKKFQLLQQLERPCAQENELLEAALAAAPRRIVIKRPAKGPYLAGRKPSFSLGGKAVRYDCLVLPRP